MVPPLNDRSATASHFLCRPKLQKVKQRCEVDRLQMNRSVVNQIRRHQPSLFPQKQTDYFD